MNRHIQPFFGVFVAALAVTLLGASSIPTLPMSKSAAMIYNPGNGDYSGFRIVVEPNGKAMAVDAAGRASNELNSDVAQRFFDDLSAAAPDIDDQDAFVRLRPTAFDAQIDQARFFPPRDNFHRRPHGFNRPYQKLPLVGGVANGAGSDCSHPYHLQLAIEFRHPRQHHAGVPQRLFRNRAGPENPFA